MFLRLLIPCVIISNGASVYVRFGENSTEIRPLQIFIFLGWPRSEEVGVPGYRLDTVS